MHKKCLCSALTFPLYFWCPLCKLPPLQLGAGSTPCYKPAFTNDILLLQVYLIFSRSVTFLVQISRLMLQVCLPILQTICVTATNKPSIYQLMIINLPDIQLFPSEKGWSSNFHQNNLQVAKCFLTCSYE